MTWRGYRKCEKCGERKPYPQGFGRTRTGKISHDCQGCASQRESPPRWRQCPICKRERRVGKEIGPRCLRCFECERAYRRLYAQRYYERDRDRKIQQAAARRRADPERQARYQRNGWDRLRSDPERHIAYLQGKRIWAHVDAERKGHLIDGGRAWALGAHDEPVTGNHGGPMLPVAPLRDWLAYEFGGWGIYELASWLGEDDSHLRRILTGGQDLISEHVADRIFVAADCPHLLALLYPERMAA